MADKPGSMQRTLKAYRTLYDKFDVNKDQQVDLKEICDALGIPEAAAKEELKSVDKNNDGLVSFEEFYLLVKNEQKKINAARKKGTNDTTWKKCFNDFDKNNDGGIGLDEFFSFWKEVDQSINQISIELLFAAADKDGSGKICYEEFSNVLDFVQG